MRTAVITGGAAGLGADVARRLSEAGYRIGIFDLGAERVAQTASEIDNAVGIEADVTSPEQIAAAFEAFGETPDLLVNNAGHQASDWSPSSTRFLENFIANAATREESSPPLINSP